MALLALLASLTSEGGREGRGLSPALAVVQATALTRKYCNRNSKAENNMEVTEHQTVDKAQTEGQTQNKINFWQSFTTIEALKLLDVWASVGTARDKNQATIPKFDAIFEKPIPNQQEWLDERTQLRIVDWASYRKDQTDRLDSREELIYLAVTTVLREADLGYEGVKLRRYFPRQGVYGNRIHQRTFDLVTMPERDRCTIRDCVHALRKAFWVERKKR